MLSVLKFLCLTFAVSAPCSLDAGCSPAARSVCAGGDVRAR